MAEVEVLRQKVKELEQDKQDLDVMLEMVTEHADDLSDQLEQERDDLEGMLEMTAEHADVVEEELQTRADTPEAQSQLGGTRLGVTSRKTW